MRRLRLCSIRKSWIAHSITPGSSGMWMRSSDESLEISQMDQIPLDQVPEGARARVEGIIREAIELDSQNQSTEALQILTVLVAEFPRTAVAHSYLAWILSRVGQHREAIQHGRV